MTYIVHNNRLRLVIFVYILSTYMQEINNNKEKSGHKIEESRKEHMGGSEGKKGKKEVF